MRGMNSYSRQRKWIIPAAIISTFAWNGFTANIVMAQDRAMFTTAKDWNLKGENLVPHGVNPLYFPLIPGHKFVLENPHFKDGIFLRKEIVVLDKTEKFDIPGIGKFECATVQEEEFYDGRYNQLAINWFCIDKVTNAVYSLGEMSWELDDKGTLLFVGTWRAGEPDGNGVAEPGLLMPGTFNVGARYIYDGSESESYGGSINWETGVKVTAPAGTFENCVIVREYNLTDVADVTDKTWCPGVGIVHDTSDGYLVASSVLPNTSLADFGKHHKEARNIAFDAPVPKLTGLQAAKVALEKVPGEAKIVTVDRKFDQPVFVVGVEAKDGAATNVFVGIESGEVVGTEKAEEEE